MPESERKRSKPLVLHIDDSALVRATTQVLLGQMGCDSITASGGHKGLDLAAKQQPDLILVDAMMPEFDGFRTTEALKLGEKTKGIPVIMLTGSERPRGVDKAKARSSGADAYLLKPVRLEKLRKKLAEFIKLPEP